MWYIEELNIFSRLYGFFEDLKTFHDHFSRPSQCRSGGSRGSRGDHSDPTYDLPNSLLPLMWNRIFAHPKSLYADAARSSLRWASHPSHHACPSFFLQKEYLCSKDLR